MNRSFIASRLLRVPRPRPAPCPVVIAFTDDIGQVAVMIENHTTGMYEQELTNSAQGLAVYQVSGTPGIYSVTVTRADGRSYSELFAIQ